MGVRQWPDLCRWSMPLCRPARLGGTAPAALSGPCEDRRDDDVRADDRGHAMTGAMRGRFTLLVAAVTTGVVLGLFPGAGTAEAATSTFAPKVDYPTGTGPNSVAVGDFNGDGDLDLVTANTAANTVSVLLSNGAGTFAAKTDYATGTNPRSVAVGDFNGDGRLDLVTANASGTDTVSVLLNNGDGTFGAKADYPTGSGTTSVAVGDFNGDGRLDLVTANFFGSTVSVLLNNGGGTFAPKADVPTGTGPNSVAVGDFNGDGDLDLATANINGPTVSVLLNNGDGTFAPKTDYPTGTVPASVAVGDFNGDGDLDLATANEGAFTVSVLLNNGDGTFAPKADYGTGDFPVSVAVGDFNGDGRLDLVTANSGGSADTVSVLLNNGDGTFGAKTNYTTGSFPLSVAVGDFNGGLPDLVSANAGANTVSVLLNTTGSGSAAPVITSPADGSTIKDCRGRPGKHSNVMGSTGRRCTVTFTGTGGPGDTISVTGEHGATICTTTVDTAGNWSCTSKTPISRGQYTFTPTATDAGGGTTTGPSVTVTIKPQPHNPYWPQAPHWDLDAAGMTAADRSR
ncbi:FG-GAP-like repeat-containing protein [Streptomyces sp900116325]|uniref:FG-GAP-like repeat-containing protein n=1 Tax=Streptomyces sp. 900116325 TaxID=3154295 RepID=UPI003325C87B